MTYEEAQGVQLPVKSRRERALARLTADYRKAILLGEISETTAIALHAALRRSGREAETPYWLARARRDRLGRRRLLAALRRSTGDRTMYHGELVRVDRSDRGTGFVVTLQEETDASRPLSQAATHALIADLEAVVRMLGTNGGTRALRVTPSPAFDGSLEVADMLGEAEPLVDASCSNVVPLHVQRRQGHFVE